MLPSRGSPDPGIEPPTPASSALQVDSAHTEPPREHYIYVFFLCTLSCFSRVWLCATPWTVIHQAPLSMGFSRQEHCWVAMPSSRGSSRPRDWNPCLLRLLHWQAGSWEALSFFSRAQEKMYFLKELWLKKVKRFEAAVLGAIIPKTWCLILASSVSCKVSLSGNSIAICRYNQTMRI